MANYFNAEKYPDPTAYEALHKVELEEKKQKKLASGEWFMKWIYIASPYKGDITTNIENAKEYARFVSKKCYVPIVPHLFLTQFLDDAVPEERDAGLALGLQMLKRCHALWVFGGYVSEGMANEIRFAVKNNIPVKYFNKNCEEVSGYGN